MATEDDPYTPTNSCTSPLNPPGLSWLNSLVTVVCVAVRRPVLYPGGAAAGWQTGGRGHARPSGRQQAACIRGYIDMVLL